MLTGQICIVWKDAGMVSEILKGTTAERTTNVTVL